MCAEDVGGEKEGEPQDGLTRSEIGKDKPGDGESEDQDGHLSMVLVSRLRENGNNGLWQEDGHGDNSGPEAVFVALCGLSDVECFDDFS